MAAAKKIRVNLHDDDSGTPETNTLPHFNNIEWVTGGGISQPYAASFNGEITNYLKDEDGSITTIQLWRETEEEWVEGAYTDRRITSGVGDYPVGFFNSRWESTLNGTATLKFTGLKPNKPYYFETATNRRYSPYTDVEIYSDVDSAVYSDSASSTPAPPVTIVIAADANGVATVTYRPLPNSAGFTYSAGIPGFTLQERGPTEVNPEIYEPTTKVVISNTDVVRQIGVKGSKMVSVVDIDSTAYGITRTLVPESPLTSQAVADTVRANAVTGMQLNTAYSTSEVDLPKVYQQSIVSLHKAIGLASVDAVEIAIRTGGSMKINNGMSYFEVDSTNVGRIAVFRVNNPNATINYGAVSVNLPEFTSKLKNRYKARSLTEKYTFKIIP